MKRPAFIEGVDTKHEKQDRHESGGVPRPGVIQCLIYANANQGVDFTI